MSNTYRYFVDSDGDEVMERFIALAENRSIDRRSALITELLSTTRRIEVDPTAATAALLDDQGAPRLRESSDEDFQRRVRIGG